MPRWWSISFTRLQFFSRLCCVQPVMYVFPKCPDDGASLLQDFSFFHVHVVYSLWCMYSLGPSLHGPGQGGDSSGWSSQEESWTGWCWIHRSVMVSIAVAVPFCLLNQKAVPIPLIVEFQKKKDLQLQSFIVPMGEFARCFFAGHHP